MPKLAAKFNADTLSKDKEEQIVGQNGLRRAGRSEIERTIGRQTSAGLPSEGFNKTANYFKI